jgi:hypothetical protein
VVYREPFNDGGGSIIFVCECGEFIERDTFRDYIKTSANPSTPTIGHCKCGLIFNFVDGKPNKRYSTKNELKVLAMKYTRIKGMDDVTTEKFLGYVTTIKTNGNLSDVDVLQVALDRLKKERRLGTGSLS